ncbi:MAG: sulfatase-like hydrolase/transferase, partial [Verrucomicrobia bacterium]|nr:sulfatase-like hydrolase/transferase [Verrucomicrobiota bacterium]
MLNRKIIIVAVILFWVYLAYGTERMPNVVLIMADDLGAETLACYGNSVYSTPVLDQMAHEGARFNNAFSTPVCSPTRAMILTGLYPNRTGFLERLDSPLDTENINRLPVHLKTFGQLFQSAGYATAIAGKWHLGSFEKYPDQPKSHGFDEHCLWTQYWDGTKRSRYYAPDNWENSEHKEHGKETFGPDYYSDFLLGFIERNRDRPFLAYYPMNLIHGPMITPPGLEELAQRNYPNDLGENERKMGHMITYMDMIVGKFLDKLKEIGQEENTLVIFTGDNGTAGTVSRLGDFHVRGGKRTMNEAGTRVPFIARWPGKIPAGVKDSFFTLM